MTDTPTNPQEPTFEEALAAAKNAAAQLPEDQLAFGLDAQHGPDPQGGSERSDSATCRMAQPAGTWTAQAGAADKSGELKR